MSQERTTEIWLHVGKKNTGKTYMTKQIMADFYAQNIKVLIVDINGQEDYDGFNTITVDQIPFFRELDIVTVRDQWDKRRIFEAMDYIHTYVRNTFVVLEDSTSYVKGNVNESIQRLVLNCRNACNDLLFNVHSFNRVGPFLYEHTDWYMIRETGDYLPLEKKVAGSHKVEQAMAEIKAENRKLYPDVNGIKTPKLAFRIIDPNA
jgi:hypothetical protein